MTGFENWTAWRARREERLRAPHGILALTGTHWLEDEPAPIVPGEPVLWAGSPDGMTVTVTAKAEHGLVFAGEPIDGTVTLFTDSAPNPSTVEAPAYGIRLVPIARDGHAALRVYDQDAEARANFAGIDVFDYDPDAAVEAVYTPYAAERTEQVMNADGRRRGLDLAGTVAFTWSGERRELAVGRNPGGSLQAVFGDAAGGATGHGFRFLTLPAPDADGRTTADFNRAYLPPCAFVEHFVCPYPPAGNRLAVAIEAGEKAVRWRDAA
ncbi:MAG TPA: DUF1684 domain-containing protein [Actinocrinis sp.]|jgi:hypothetical protein